MVQINTPAILLFVCAGIGLFLAIWKRLKIFAGIAGVLILIGLFYMFIPNLPGSGDGGGVSGGCGGLPIDVCYCCRQPGGQVVYDCDPNCLSSANDSVRVDMQVCYDRENSGEVNANCRQIVN